MTRWVNTSDLRSKEFNCGFCARAVASGVGYFQEKTSHRVYICPNCKQPNYFQFDLAQIPGPMPGEAVEAVPELELKLYEEARRCVSANAPTSAVLACRKLLMHIAVSQGAAKNESFLNYVNYLSDKGYVPPNGKGWVDHIRKKGNEANHEIVLMNAEDAKELIAFAGMLLKFIYEFPSRIPTSR